MMRRVGGIGCIMLAFACGDAAESPDSPPDPPGTPARPALSGASPTVARNDTALADTATERTVTIYFSRGEDVVAVRRATPDSALPLEASLRALLAGPSPEERAAGLSSWFSDETAGYLISAAVRDSVATIDFRDLRDVIPNASTSTGSTRLLGELNATVFEDPRVRVIDYRMEGSCDLFWDWLQYGCMRVWRDRGLLEPEDPVSNATSDVVEEIGQEQA